MPQALTFAQISDQPGEYLNIQQYDVQVPGAGEVLLRMLAAPINPQDIMVLAGKYPVKPENCEGGEPVPGYDGLAEVLRCGNGVTSIKVGDRVVPKRHGLGTWRTHAILRETSLVKVPSSADPSFAANLRMGVTPAYLLLEDMTSLKPGDWIIQNAASGYIAQMVCQFARLKGLHSINIIRDRVDVLQTHELKEELGKLGADVVLTETELVKEEHLGKGRRIKLALDSVFGPLAELMATHLSPNAMFVNYGSLGVQGRTGALQLTQELLFWRQITFRNFRLSACLDTRSEEEMRDMLTWFVSLSANGSLRAAHVDNVPWSATTGEADIEGVKLRLKQAVARAGAKGVGAAKKQMFLFGH